jgi:hypothetical protein
MDFARRHPDAAERERRQARVSLLIPVLKAWCSELGVEIASTGVQVHGGMGYVEETGACQYLRDSRIAPIYEGTTGIQAADLVGRKLAMDQGATMAGLIREMRSVEGELKDRGHEELNAIREALATAIDALQLATRWVLETVNRDPQAAMAASVNYLMLVGYVCGGWQMARAALVCKRAFQTLEDHTFYRQKLATARFYADQILPKVDALLKAVTSGASTAMSLTEEQF